MREELADCVPGITRTELLEWVERPEACSRKVSAETCSEWSHCAPNHPTSSKGVIRPESCEIQRMRGGQVQRHIAGSHDLRMMTHAADTSEPRGGERRSFFPWPMLSFRVYAGNALGTYLWRERGVDGCTAWRGGWKAWRRG